MKNKSKSLVKTNCIKCWKEITVSFQPAVKKINSLEVECCNNKFKTKWTVLVIDDDIQILSTVKRMLEKIGFEVTIWFQFPE